MVYGEPRSGLSGDGPSRPRIIIVGSQRLFTEGLGKVLQDRGLNVLAVEHRGRRAVATVRQHRPDIVLIDLDLSILSGLTVGKRIAVEVPEARLIALAALDDPNLVGEAFRSGFRGYVNKRATIAELVAAIEAAPRSHVVLPSHAIRRLLAAEGAKGTKPRQSARAHGKLTRRQRGILELMAEGLNVREIAARLSLSPNTVRTHIRNILSKMRVGSPVEAIIAAHQGVRLDERSKQHITPKPGPNALRG
jgi:DNA-binding NarL/FixJ family response regulator